MQRCVAGRRLDRDVCSRRGTRCLGWTPKELQSFYANLRSVQIYKLDVASVVTKAGMLDFTSPSCAIPFFPFFFHLALNLWRPSSNGKAAPSQDLTHPFSMALRTKPNVPMVEFQVRWFCPCWSNQKKKLCHLRIDRRVKYHSLQFALK